jgi:predicted MFS family arabinose efflux permease
MVNRRLVLAFVCSVGGTVSFYLLLSVVPLYATTVGAGAVGAGLTTAALMLATVAAELATPWLIAVLGYRTLFALGLILLGVPALALGWSGSAGAGGACTASACTWQIVVILVVCLIRGVGFAIIAVLGSAIAALLVPADRRGEGLGLYGLVVGIPSVIVLPLGVWLATHVGFGAVFVAGTVFALTGLTAVHSLPGRAPAGDEGFGLHNPALIRPAFVFAATTTATGVVVTFLPVANGATAPLALLAQAATSTLTRWWGGRFSDRYGASRLVIPAVLVSAAGMLGLLFVPSPIAMLVFGLGFGAAQSATLNLMFSRVPESGYGTASALWNLAYDTGVGLGAAGFGLVAAQTGYPTAFGLTGVLVLAALLPALLDARVSKTALRSQGAAD